MKTMEKVTMVMIDEDDDDDDGDNDDTDERDNEGADDEGIRRLWWRWWHYAMLVLAFESIHLYILH